MKNAGMYWFSDNFHTFWKSDVMQGNLRLPAAHGRTSFIDARDIAACAVAALTADKFDGKAFELTGPESLDYQQAAEILSAATERHIAYTPLAEDQYIKVRTARTKHHLRKVGKEAVFDGLRF